MPIQDKNITAKVICKSVNKFGNILTTFVVTYPRVVIAEVNTHRMLSRSSASSRAIPIHKQIDKVETNPWFPSFLGANQKGMQAKKELEGDSRNQFWKAWIAASKSATHYAQKLEEIGVHKQITNRLLEPFCYVTTIISATDLANFFKLRCHPDAQHEFMVLAFRMLEAFLDTDAVETDLHIPFGDRMDPGWSEQDRIKVACARCARVSYENHDGVISLEDDLRLYQSLKDSGHMSPFEHVATSHINDTYVGNFQGWVQHRKMIQGENVNKIDYEKLYNTKPDWV